MAELVKNNLLQKLSDQGAPQVVAVKPKSKPKPADPSTVVEKAQVSNMAEIKEEPVEESMESKAVESSYTSNFSYREIYDDVENDLQNDVLLQNLRERSDHFTL
jgi:hypothetical protein